MRKISLLLALFFIIPVAYAEQEVVALHPKTFLNLLPKPDTGWKIEASWAEQEFAEYPNVTTYAMRVFNFTPPEESKGRTDEKPPAKPMKVTIRAEDTAYTPGKTEIVDRLYSKSDDAKFFPNEVETKALGEPVISFQHQERFFYYIGVRNRFWIGIVLEGFDKKSAETWFKNHVDIGQFHALLSRERPVPRSFKDGQKVLLYRVNEVQPEDNSFTTLTYYEGNYDEVKKRFKQRKLN